MGKNRNHAEACILKLERELNDITQQKGREFRLGKKSWKGMIEEAKQRGISIEKFLGEIGPNPT